MKGYSVQKHHGNWVLRRSVYTKDGVRTQPQHILGSIRNFPKESDITPLAEEYMARVRRSKTVRAAGTVSAFVEDVFVPFNAGRLKKDSIKLYALNWRRLEPHIGSLRVRNVACSDIQSALDTVYEERGDEIGHNAYLHMKVTVSAIFSLAIRRGDHPGPNPEDSTTVRKYGHTKKRPNEAVSINEIQQFLTLFPTGNAAVAIGINAFLALRKPEVQALTPEDFDQKNNRIRVHTDTKTGNDEWLPVIAPLRKILGTSWDKVNMRRCETEIRKRIKGTSLKWKGWYSFRRGMLSNLWLLGVPVEEAAHILRNSAEVCREHYLKFEAEASKQRSMDTLEKAYESHPVEPIEFLQ